MPPLLQVAQHEQVFTTDGTPDAGAACDAAAGARVAQEEHCCTTDGTSDVSAAYAAKESACAQLEHAVH
jgi:hypothetical protein